jgi:glutamate--cysteine ligase
MLTHADIVGYFAQGIKPVAYFKMGIEYERFALNAKTGQAADYPAIRDFLEMMAMHGPYQPVYESGHCIGLAGDNGTITLEPGGQIEFSSAPAKTIAAVADNFHRYLEISAQVAAKSGLIFVARGIHPLGTKAVLPWMPKQRYAIMRDYMPRVGTHGLMMMQHTASIQVNLDYSSAADMAAKYKLAMVAQPLLAALLANAPQDGYASFRQYIWQHTDAARTGMLPAAMRPDFGFAAYADFVLNAPMYFVYRQGRYIDAAGEKFADFIQGRLTALPGEYATIGDWANHAGTVFPQIRLKPWLELRGCDSHRPEIALGILAFWQGLLSHPPSLAAGLDLIKHWSWAEIQVTYAQLPRTGLQGDLAKTPMRAIIAQLMALAEQGLTAAESPYLYPLLRI